MFNTTLTGFIINIITLTNSFFTSLICFIILIILIFRYFYMKNVHLLLCTNTYLTIFVYSLASGSLYIDTLRGDIQLNYKINNLRFCRIRGSFVLALFSTIFGAFCLQALFRLYRIVYQQYKILQNYYIQLIFIIIKWLFSFTFVWLVDIVYLPTEYYCSVPFNTLKPILLATFIAYGFPSTMIALIYIRIVLYIRSQQRLIKFQHRTRRDFQVIRRIVIIVSTLWLLGMPSTILLVYGQIHHGNIHPLTYRIEWITPSFALIILSISLIKYDSYLMQILFPKKRYKYESVNINLPRINTQSKTFTDIIAYK